MHNITTTAGKQFTYVESVDLARLIYKRFGLNADSATAAWCRLLENNTTVGEFMKLVEHHEHTPHCSGWCCSLGHLGDEP